MIQGFKDFITRGNVIDLAVAVVIGGAFAKIVDIVVTNVVTPVLAAVGGANSEGLGFELISGNAATRIDLSAIINALIVFFITALVVYFVFVVPMNKYKEMRGITAEDPVDENLETLKEIRNLLAERRTL